MKGKTVRRFFLIKYHTDAEFSAFLQSKAEQGLKFVDVKGNFFTFSEKEYDGCRICVRTLYRKEDEYSTELQVRSQLPALRKAGWDCLLVGKQETLRDVQRHVYFIEEKQGSKLPKTNSYGEKRARFKGRLKSLSNLILFSLLSVVLAIFFSMDLSVPYKIVVYAFAVFLAVCGVFCILTCFDCFVTKRKPQLLDVSTRLLSWFLRISVLCLLLDYIVTR